MRLALMIEGQEGVKWEQWVALARACEANGIDSMFRSDHYLGIARRGDAPGSLDAWSTICGLAAVTERVRLGTMVSPVTFRPASVLAKSAVTADHISDGRIDVGIGAGWFEAEHEAYGFPFMTARERVALLAEQIETIVRQWTEDERAQPKPVQQPHPPLIVGGNGKPGTIRPAVRRANEYNTTGAGPDECRRRRELLDRACEGVGRDPATLPLSLMRTVVGARADSELHDRVRRFLEVASRDDDVEEFLRGVNDDQLIGTVEQVAEKMRRYEDAGVTRLMCQHLVHEDLEMVEILGRELAPAVA